MMFKSKEQARKALHKQTGLRAYLIEGEMISPAEVWLLDTLYHVTPITRTSLSRKAKRRLVSLAKTLELWPIPDWYYVLRRFKEKKETSWKDVGQAFAKQSQLSWCAMFLNEQINKM